jgi:MFS family permease
MTEETRPFRLPTPWYYGWNMIAVGIGCQLIVYGVIVSCFSFWVAPWMEEFASERAPILVAATATLVISALISPLAGRLLDRWSVRYVMGTGLVCFASGLLLLSLAATLFQVVLFYGLSMGVAMAFAGPLATQTLAARWFRARRGFAIGIVVAGVALGGAAMPPLFTFLLSEMDWRVVARIIAALAFVMLPVVLLVVRDTPEDLGLEPEPDTAENLEAGGVAPSWTAREILAHRNFWALVAAFLPLYVAGMAIASNFAPIAADNGIDPRAAAFFYAAVNLLGSAAKVAIGKLSDILDQRMLLFGCISVTGLSLLLLAIGTPGPARLALAGILFFASTACFYPMQGAIIGRYFGPASFGRVLGMLNLFFVVGAVGGLAAAGVRDHFASYDPFLVVAGLILPVAALAIFRLQPGSGSGARSIRAAA